uniref:Uncharacterized protein n=1 Tax=Knipowitschia caucasica TaxID=637954 RepID=A0AAV2L5R6_KNICA
MQVSAPPAGRFRAYRGCNHGDRCSSGNECTNFSFNVINFGVISLFSGRHLGSPGLGLDTDVKVFLGHTHSCTCAVFLREREPCKHICWVLLKKFRIPKEHEYSFQCGLSDRQISEVLYGSHQPPQSSAPSAPRASGSSEASEDLTLGRPGEVLQRDIQAQDVCPICQEELLERKQPVAFCRFGCGNNVHISCMRVWAEHRQRSDSEMVPCPLCREDFCSGQSLREQVMNSSWLHTAAERERPDKHLGVSCGNCGVSPVSGKCFRCTVCTFLYFCEICSGRNCHPHHPLSVRLTRKKEWCLVSKESGDGSTKNDQSLPVVSAPLPDRVLAQVPTVQVRAGSQLLQDGMQCRLCLHGFSLGQRLRALPCRHKFHARCVDAILRTTNSCPLDGFVICNPEPERACGRTSLSTRYPTFQRSGTNVQDLFVPGVALLEEKHQLEVPTNNSHLTSLDSNTSNPSNANSQKCVKKVVPTGAQSPKRRHLCPGRRESRPVLELHPARSD